MSVTSFCVESPAETSGHKSHARTPTISSQFKATSVFLAILTQSRQVILLHNATGMQNNFSGLGFRVQSIDGI